MLRVLVGPQFEESCGVGLVTHVVALGPMPSEYAGLNPSGYTILTWSFATTGLGTSDRSLVRLVQKYLSSSGT